MNCIGFQSFCDRLFEGTKKAMKNLSVAGYLWPSKYAIWVSAQHSNVTFLLQRGENDIKTDYGNDIDGGNLNKRS